MKNPWLIIAGCLLCGGSLLAHEPLTNWEFRLGDSPRSGNTFDWSRDVAPWTRQEAPLGDIRGDQRVAWQRIKLPSTRYEDPVVYIEICFEQMEVFLDGKQIYSYGSVDDFKPGWLFPSIWFHAIELPPNYAGKYLYFRIRADAPSMGVERALKIGNRADLFEYILKSDLEVFMLGCVFVFVGFFSLFMYLSRFGEGVFLVFSGYVFGSGIYTILRTQTLNLLSPHPDFWIWPWFISLYLLPVLSFAYFEAILAGRFKKFLRIVWQIHLIIAIVSLSLPAFHLIPLFDLLAPFQYTALVDLILLVGVPAYAAYKKDTDAKLIIIGYAIQTLFFLHDILKDQGFIPYDRTINHWGLFIFVGFLALILLRRYRNTQERLHAYSRELEEKNIQLSRMDRMKDEFLANTSHELKTPLHGMIGIAESLVDAGQDHLSIDLTRKLGLIAQSGRRLSGLVNNILEYSRLKHDSPSLVIRPVRLRQAVQSAFEIVRPLMNGKPVELVNEVDDSFSPVRADENRLQQIFLNLLANAMKFTESGSIRVSAVLEDGFARIRVIDTGSGIPNEYIETIFKPFESAPSGNSGTGLGLSIARQLVRLQGGEIRAEQGLTAGATIWFTLPVWNESESVPLDDIAKNRDVEIAAASPAIWTSSENNGQGQVKILAVDDEPVNLQILLNRLKIAGYQIHQAQSGAQALREIENGSYDLVLLDIMMPGISGLEVCKQIREKYSLYELPVLFLSARGAVEDVVAGFEAGGNDYVIKPFNGRELISRVTTLLSLRHAVREERKLAGLRHEVHIAQKLQQSLLPGSSPRDLTFSFRYQPRSPVGGDFFDYIDSEKGTGFILADVAGHGVAAALVASMAKIAFSIQTAVIEQPSLVLGGMNDILSGQPHDHYATAAYLFFNRSNQTFSYASAGHAPMIVIRAGGGVELVKPRGTILGAFRGRSYESCELRMNPGDRILVYTDGVTESRNGKGEMLGDEKFVKLARQHGKLPIETFADQMLREFDAWVGDSPDDDFAFFVIDA